MKNSLHFILLLLFLGCSSKKEKEVIITTNNTYKQSEMAALMLQMYAANLENKKLILEGKTPADFPDEFLNIHTAKLTDASDRNASFNSFSEYYLKTLAQVYTAKDSLKLKHNNAINSCIACHQTTCLGPIPKIKKLLIK
ncbi:hypothetical protein MC378_07200 [Polaribacter sp. MSW13]|uniref:Cytochrome c domain-containing protein n=1 Tax=Polaribacter marinus TaxID=2916838 RepID=A0A9X1VLY5_9FLAO|nr:hypothetical protein [Polaribacter marinus]MCI2228949.1 hypothetical protein [Polaribacter marinus]